MALSPNRSSKRPRNMASKRSNTPLRRLTLVILVAVGMVAGNCHSLPAADKIRLSVTNFNMSFLPAGLLSNEVFSQKKDWRRRLSG